MTLLITYYIFKKICKKKLKCKYTAVYLNLLRIAENGNFLYIPIVNVSEC